MSDRVDISSGSQTGGTPPNLNPDDLFLRLSSQGVMCTEPRFLLECGQNWSVSIALPPEYQTVGVYDLGDGKISMYSSQGETGEVRSGPDDCSRSSGTIGAGSVEILAIDASKVQFRLELEPSFWDTNPNGEYTAVRCD